jgi:hypothetical protein
LGFKPALVLDLRNASIVEERPEALTRDVVYVALLPENEATIERIQAVKVGPTGTTLLGRRNRRLEFSKKTTALDPAKKRPRQTAEDGTA